MTASRSLARRVDVALRHGRTSSVDAPSHLGDDGRAGAATVTGGPDAALAPTCYSVPSDFRFNHMSDNSPVVAATPYPFYSSGGNDDNADRAVLISHTGASVERNQDAGFSALRSQLVHRDVEQGKRETVQAKFDLAIAQKDFEIRAADRHSELKAELAALRAEGLGREIAGLRAEATASKMDAVLAAIKALSK